jgi:hypothetical protein
MNITKRLQGVGLVNAKAASLVVAGDELQYNYGDIYTVEAVRDVSAKFVEFDQRSAKGTLYTNRYKKDKLVGLA